MSSAAPFPTCICHTGWVPVNQEWAGAWTAWPAGAFRASGVSPPVGGVLPNGAVADGLEAVRPMPAGLQSSCLVKQPSGPANLRLSLPQHPSRLLHRGHYRGLREMGWAMGHGFLELAPSCGGWCPGVDETPSWACGPQPHGLPRDTPCIPKDDLLHPTPSPVTPACPPLRRPLLLPHGAGEGPSELSDTSCCQRTDT